VTFQELLDTFIQHGARVVGQRYNGVLVEFMVYTIFIPHPMNGKTYDSDELKHNLASYRQITNGEIYEDYTSIFSFNGSSEE